MATRARRGTSLQVRWQIDGRRGSPSREKGRMEARGPTRRGGHGFAGNILQPFGPSFSLLLFLFLIPSISLFFPSLPSFHLLSLLSALDFSLLHFISSFHLLAFLLPFFRDYSPSELWAARWYFFLRSHSVSFSSGPSSFHGFVFLFFLVILPLFFSPLFSFPFSLSLDLSLIFFLRSHSVSFLFWNIVLLRVCSCLCLLTAVRTTKSDHVKTRSVPGRPLPPRNTPCLWTLPFCPIFWLIAFLSSSSSLLCSRRFWLSSFVVLSFCLHSFVRWERLSDWWKHIEFGARLWSIHSLPSFLPACHTFNQIFLFCFFVSLSLSSTCRRERLSDRWEHLEFGAVLWPVHSQPSSHFTVERIVAQELESETRYASFFLLRFCLFLASLFLFVPVLFFLVLLLPFLFLFSLPLGLPLFSSSPHSWTFFLFFLFFLLFLRFSWSPFISCCHVLMALRRSNIIHEPSFLFFFLYLLRLPFFSFSSGAQGYAEIKRHSFFASIEWGLLAAGCVTPPFVPSRNEIQLRKQVWYRYVERMMTRQEEERAKTWTNQKKRNRWTEWVHGCVVDVFFSSSHQEQAEQQLHGNACFLLWSSLLACPDHSASSPSASISIPTSMQPPSSNPTIFDYAMAILDSFHFHCHQSCTAIPLCSSCALSPLMICFPLFVSFAFIFSMSDFSHQFSSFSNSFFFLCLTLSYQVHLMNQPFAIFVWHPNCKKRWKNLIMSQPQVYKKKWHIY